MVRRVSTSWLDAGENEEVLSLVLNHIGAKWPIREREKILGDISHAFFPPNTRADVLGGYDKTPLISIGEFYYFVFVSLGVKPNVWFKNL